ncbi:acetyltransferase [Arundinibacter roseus]|uniref:Acetyltransferase n=1 Tax=Arundinibacter roseus TaxID=2070510 RepID=A0A4R4K7S5_9BACT|nr:acetyltransferase [Arundinibacter roseus]TDB63638.1 acetyltransferase [Arundinibacter roseus]
MLLYGASGHAKVILSILKAMNQEVTGIFDDDPEKKEIHSIPVVGSYRADFLPNEPMIIAIGNNTIRRQLSGQIRHSFGTAVHPSAQIDTSAQISEGTVVMHGAIVQADARLGRHVILNTAATVDHDCVIGDFVHLAPGVTLCGSVSVGAHTLIGAGSVIAPNLTIGSRCLIASGSVVTTSIPDGAIVRGNPARIINRKSFRTL